MLSADGLVDVGEPVTIGPDRLTAMLQLQARLQQNVYNVPLGDLKPEERSRVVRDNTLALTDELHEALNEIGWKPWATSRHMNTAAYVSELVDAWHFFMNLLLATGLPPKEISDLFYGTYLHKMKKNEERQAAGYDGVSTKCSLCKRALDDVAVACWVRGDQGFCAVQNSDINLIKD